MIKKVCVTQECIDKGERRHPGKCAVALAFLPDKVLVAGQWIKYNGEYFRLPKRVVDLVHRFDAREVIEPFEFELNLDD